MQYRLRALLMLMTLIAFGFGGVSFLNWLNAIDGDSERVEVNSKTIQLRWKEISWEPGHSGISGNLG